MDSTSQQEATSHPTEPSSSTANLETKVLRSSARVKAAKEKEKGRALADQQLSASTSSSKRSRDSATSKGKGKEVEVPKPEVRLVLVVERTERIRDGTADLLIPLTRLAEIVSDLSFDVYYVLIVVVACRCDNHLRVRTRMGRH